MAQNLVDTEQMAKVFDLTTRRIQQLAKEGILKPAMTNPYKFDFLPTIRSYVKYLSDKVQGKGGDAPDTKDSKAKKLNAEARLKESQAAIYEIKLKEIKGEVHLSEDVEAMTNDLVYSIRSMILALPGRLAMDVARNDNANECSTLIRNECYKILEELSNYQYDPAKYEERMREREGLTDVEDDNQGERQKAE